MSSVIPRLRAMTDADRPAVADLISVSTNEWYERHGRSPIFPQGASTTAVFADVYEALDPGCCVVAEDPASGRLVASCFYHPRPTHVSLGIMNAHPDHAGRGVASSLLRFVTDFADREHKPVRLVSSAINLDSFSLYNRVGFVLRRTYQDMYFPTETNGIKDFPAASAGVRDATLDDVDAMAALEMEVAGIRREKDFRYFIENRGGFWHTAVLPGDGGSISGWIVSSGHPGVNMIGPCVARDEPTALALLLSEANHHRGRQPVFLVPVECSEMVRILYARGARNCELHFSQVRGPCQPFRGVSMPTFLPETA
jgi:GNAT superfamily N-acetyltransferase